MNTTTNEIQHLQSSSSSSSSIISQGPKLCADDFYFSALHAASDDDDDAEEAPIFPISDEIYAFQLHLQEALLSSYFASRTATTKTSSNSSQKLKSIAVDSSPTPLTPVGPRSTATCPICGDSKLSVDFFESSSCGHSYCIDCISAHIAVKMQENIFYVGCPDSGCRSALDPQACRGILPRPVLDRWEEALCESVILAARISYCPFKDCSAVMVDDGSEEVTNAECPCCWRLFCARCRVPWHSGVECSEFKSLNRDREE